jgi:hypothetical protein
MTPIISREQHEHNMYPAAHHIPQSAMSERSWAPTDSTASNLADAFGDLQIGLAATGMLGMLWRSRIDANWDSSLYNGFERIGRLTCSTGE